MVPDEGYTGPPPVIAMGAACAIFDSEGRVLLVRHTYAGLNWELPGGGAEPGESPDETAIREVTEETGLDIVLERLTGVYYEPDPRPEIGHGPLVHFVFTARPTDGRSPVVSSPEISEIRSWPPDELPRPISDFTERRIRDALTGGAARVSRVGRRGWCA
jgi:8-oxo-dGTP diphosphatase